jgi:hypothetical protein
MAHEDGDRVELPQARKYESLPEPGRAKDGRGMWL